MAALRDRQRSTLPQQQMLLFRYPYKGIQEDLRRIYNREKITLGWPKGDRRIFEKLARKNTAAIVGVALGDEGKGRFVDNKIEDLLQKKGVRRIVVVRYQGGNNAGHTIEKKGVKLALHLVPACVMFKKAIGIMDRGMLIHPEDLKTEVAYIEEKVGTLERRLFLSEEAILCTDLERAEEVLNRQKAGAAKGGTGRGVAPAYAHNLDRLGLKIYDLLLRNWKETLSYHYDRYVKEFKVYNVKLDEVLVPDFATTQKVGKEAARTVGSKNEFLKRLEEARTWLLKRNLATNTFLMHHALFTETSYAILFEGAQAAGLDAWTGTRPDITASNTTTYGIREGTGYWLPHMVEERIGLLKIPYTSSVGARKMPTHAENEWALFVREKAHEYGTTTGRPRDITHLDLAFITYNACMAGVETLVGTHLDIAQEIDTIKVCTHYENEKGEYIPYQPGLMYQRNVTAQYVDLPGWDGEACKAAKKAKDLPKNARTFLAFIQARIGFPIVAVTTGSLRDNIIKF